MDDAHELDQRIAATTKQSLAATERIVAVAEETRETAGDIIVKLEHQGEQIQNIRRTAEDVHEEAYEARRDISKLGCFSCCFCASRPRRKPKKRSPSPNTHDRKTDRAENGHNTKSSLAEGPIIKKITNDPLEDKIDENLRWECCPPDTVGRWFEPAHFSALYI